MRAGSRFWIFTLGQIALAKDISVSWNITWVNAAPDGFERPVIGINGEWPCPQLDVDVGDHLTIEVYNGLGNQSTGIHWHGIHQYNAGTMDGSSDVTQCPIAPDQAITYEIDFDQPGTYWYHSHNMGQYPDGLRGPLIVHDPSPPFEFDDEITITLTDWYHEQMPVLLQEYEAKSNGEHGHEPLPAAALVNDNSASKIKVEPNKTYLVRWICLGNWPGHAFLIDDHDFTIVEVDGVYTDPYPVDGGRLVRLATGQRVAMLMKTKSNTSKNYALWDTMDINMMFAYENRDIPAGFNENATAWIVYDENAPLPPAPDVHSLEFVDDVALTPYDHEPLLEPVDHQIILDMDSAVIDGVTRYTINNETYLSQKVPTLYTALTVGPEYYSDPTVYGQVNPYIINSGEVVEIVINDHHDNLHPWHLHGHQFQVLQRTDPYGGYFDGYFANVSSTPMKRDTIMVQNKGHTVIRFRADNPGVWLLHCHIEFHVESGLMATIIEAPTEMQDMFPPFDHFEVCASYPQPMRGNAAGKDGEDLRGANDEIPTTYGATYPPE